MEPPTGEVPAERVRGIEPPFSAWEADVLPLNYTRGRIAMVAGGAGPHILCLAVGPAPFAHPIRPETPQILMTMPTTSRNRARPGR